MSNKNSQTEEHQKSSEKDQKVKENEYTPGEQKFADGEGTKLDEAIDEQKKKK